MNKNYLTTPKYLQQSKDIVVMSETNKTNSSDEKDKQAMLINLMQQANNSATN